MNCASTWEFAKRTREGKECRDLSSLKRAGLMRQGKFQSREKAVKNRKTLLINGVGSRDKGGGKKSRKGRRIDPSSPSLSWRKHSQIRRALRLKGGKSCTTATFRGVITAGSEHRRGGSVRLLLKYSGEVPTKKNMFTKRKKK